MQGIIKNILPFITLYYIMCNNLYLTKNQLLLLESTGLQTAAHK